MSDQSNQSSNIGSWDERGLLNSFKKKGITNFSAISEYLANSIDANAYNVKLIFEKDEFIFIDDGLGMNYDKVTNMFSCYRANHTNEKSKGIVGIGAKLASAFISDYKNTCIILTKSEQDQLLKVNIPWGEIYQEGIYICKIQVEIMSFDEKEKFYKYLQLLNPNSKTGTLIIHKFNKYADIDLLNTITHQFDMNYLKKNFHEKKNVGIVCLKIL